MEDLIKMINTGEIPIDIYFRMQPFFYADNRFFRNFFDKNEDFYKYFYVTSNKTYERLVSIINLMQNRRLKAMIITGYRGCGKTNFVNYCKDIMTNRTSITDFDKTLEFELSNLDKSMSEKTREKITKKIKDNYAESFKKIKDNLFYSNIDENDEINYSNIADEINKKLKANCEYINFDVDKYEKTYPLSLKITRLIEDVLEEIWSNENDINSSVIDFYMNNENAIRNAFENKNDLNVRAVFDYLSKYTNHRNYRDIQNGLINKLSKLDSDQLLMILSLYKYAIQINKEDEKYNFYIFDNIDFISDEKNIVFQNTIEIFWAFLQEMGSLMDNISDNQDNEKWIDCYNKVNYIFAMRETTSMHICDHLRDVMRATIDHMDISADVNRAYIFKKKIFYLEENRGKICNDKFINFTDAVNKISSDVHFANNLMIFFNNNYKTAIECLSKIYIGKEKKIKFALDLLQYQESYCRFGARAIIYRQIFDLYLKSYYFRDVGITSSRGREYNANFENWPDFSYVRLILTIIQSKQKDGKFFINLEDSVSLENLYNQISFIDKDDFFDCLYGMFSLRNTTYWSHLLTFDNILTYSNDYIKETFDNENLDVENKKPVLVRTTCAGNVYLDFMCTHFEFFATRFSRSEYSLFEDHSLEVDNQGEYNFSKIIKTVYEAVKECCKKLKEVNNKILEFTNYKIGDDELLNTPYFYHQMYHEERIIHQHISYLDSYRLYLVNIKKNVNIVEVNKKIVENIKEYISLLLTVANEYDLKNSIDMCTELNKCVEQIEANNYYDTETRIDREYYKQVISDDR